MKFMVHVFRIYYLNRYDVMHTQCTGKSRAPLFLRAEGMNLNFGNSTKYSNVDYEKCANICLMKNDEDGRSSCNSFSFSNTEHQCSVSAQNAQPFGSGVLSSTPREQAIFHQKICLKMPYTCLSLVVFDWFPQHVLIGFANEVKTQTSLPECLSSCLEVERMVLNSPKRICKSVMYYYDTKECILNSVDRTVRPDLFVDDTQGYVVDYFENRCTPSSVVSGPPPEVSGKPVIEPLDCVGRSSLSLQYTNAINKQLTTLKPMKNVEFFQCKIWCDTNKVRNEIAGAEDMEIVCRGFNYDNVNKICSLDLNENGDSEASKPVLQDKNGANYYEKICLTHGFKCNNLAEKSAFIRYPMRVFIGHSQEVYHYSTVSDCLDSCLNSRATNGFRCSSVMYYYETGECIVNAVNKKANPDLFSEDTQGFIVDYFENNCENDNYPHYYTQYQTSVTPYDNFFNTSTSSYALNGENSPYKYTIPILEKDTQVKTIESIKNSGINAPSSTISGEFSDYHGTTEDFTLPPSPLPLLLHRNRELKIFPSTSTLVTSDNSRIVDSTEQTLDILIIPAPTRSLVVQGSASKDGGEAETSINERVDPSPSLKAECYQNFVRVILTSENLISGILSSKSIDRKLENTPAHCQRAFNNSNLVVLDLWRKTYDNEHTSCDAFMISENKQVYTIVKDDSDSETEIYNITCDFSNLEISDSRNFDSKSQTSNGTIDSDQFVSMELLRNNMSVHSVLLGETLILRWRLNSDNDSFSFFIRSCDAESIGGIQKSQPSLLKLFNDGCPENDVYEKVILSPISRISSKVLESKFSVFRFDGSKNVRIQCSVDVCLKSCNPSECRSSKYSNFQSFGRRKKRRDDLKIYSNATLPNYSFNGFSSKNNASSRHITEHRLIMSEFVIVDHLPKNDAPSNPDYESTGKNKNKDEFCASQGFFMILFSSLSTVCLIEIAVVIFLHRTKIANFWEQLFIENSESSARRISDCYSSCSIMTTSSAKIRRVPHRKERSSRQ